MMEYEGGNEEKKNNDKKKKIHLNSQELVDSVTTTPLEDFCCTL